jgi:hypothetical protein
MYTPSASPASSPLRKFEGLVARAQEDAIFTQRHLRDIRSQLINLRSETAGAQKNNHWYGSAMQIVGLVAGIAAGAKFQNPKMYEMVSTTVNLFKTLIVDTKGYDYQARLERLQHELQIEEMVNQAVNTHSQALVNVQARIDQNRQASMGH